MTDDPLSALRATSAEEEARCVFAREQRDRGKLPGGWRSTEYILYRLSGGIFRYAQYDVLSFTRHSERSEESH